MSSFRHTDILDDEQIASFFLLEEVQAAKQRIDKQTSGSVYFTVDITESIRTRLQEKIGLDLSSVASVPMRWIKGDTAPHVDIGMTTFDKTYVMYLTDSIGQFIIDSSPYPIAKGSAYIFPESVQHETIHTGTEPRLLLGPMSNDGFAVGGGGGINGDGGTTVYIRQENGAFEYSSNRSQWTQFYTPTTVTNTNTTLGVFVLEFVSDIEIVNPYHYFVCGSSHIQFGSRSLNIDGSRPVFMVDTTEYLGLIQNGTETNDGYSNIYIYNLVVNATVGSTLYTSLIVGVESGGWIGQMYFGKASTDNYIVNCSSNGNIAYSAGGIVGNNAGMSSGVLTIIGCSSSGTIGQSAGGITGNEAGNTNGNVICESCWSTGIIGINSGGIMGFGARNATISNCYSTGVIGTNGGGICGRWSGVNGNVSITKCYSTGSVLSGAGGIVGNVLGYGAGNITITNCYSLGNMDTGSGGIIGSIAGVSYSVSNCYTVGNVTASNGYIFGLSSEIPVTCYSEANTGTPGSWSSTHANTVLIGTPTPTIGTVWVAAGLDQPYELLNMGYTPYTIQNITSTPSLLRQFSSTVSAGSPTLSAIITGRNYTILQTTGGDGVSTCDSSTGAITASTAGVYSIYVRNTGSYHITEYVVTVIPASAGAGSPVSCCARPTYRRGGSTDIATYIGLKIGNTYLGSISRRNMSYSEMMTMKKALMSKK